jgi:hypothetical protein
MLVGASVLRMLYIGSVGGALLTLMAKVVHPELTIRPPPIEELKETAFSCGG